jgi:beta-phosphoglucomutase-like phosphatase (HAD superfamily)
LHIEVFEDGDLGIEAAHKAGMVATDVRSWYDSNW